MPKGRNPIVELLTEFSNQQPSSPDSYLVNNLDDCIEKCLDDGDFALMDEAMAWARANQIGYPYIRAGFAKWMIEVNDLVAILLPLIIATRNRETIQRCTQSDFLPFKHPFDLGCFRQHLALCDSQSSFWPLSGLIRASALTPFDASANCTGFLIETAKSLDDLLQQVVAGTLKKQRFVADLNSRILDYLAKYGDLRLETVADAESKAGGSLYIGNFIWPVFISDFSEPSFNDEGCLLDFLSSPSLVLKDVEGGPDQEAMDDLIDDVENAATDALCEPATVFHCMPPIHLLGSPHELADLSSAMISTVNDHAKDQTIPIYLKAASRQRPGDN